jgi:ubiquinone/menaquinone biosynthesis C-methylase UbiE
MPSSAGSTFPLEKKTLLDVACGSGGPALRIAAKTGCSVTGVDLHEQAIATAKVLASQRLLGSRSQFHLANASDRLPFADAAFDAVTCIDAINHLPDRPRVVAEWARVLKPNGRLLFTDPITLTGPLTHEEMRIRSSIGYFLFVPLGYDEQVIAQCQLRLLERADVTPAMAEVAEGRRAAREARALALRRIEGDATFETEQTFLSVAARVARERRLSRFLYACQKSA